MDPIKSFLGRELLEEITPVVMVLSTPRAEDSCNKNGIGLVDMLHPFSLIRNINVPVRTASDQPYRLQVFKLRLVYASDVRQRSQEAANERLKQVVGDASERMLPDLRSDPPQLETVLSKSESDFRPSWIQTFNKELMHTVSFSEHEAFDHPVACLLVVSSKDDQPINKFVDLFNTDQLPSLLNEGAMDPKILKHYLLLHDNQYGTPEKAAGILVEMRSTFGSNDCKLLCINSAQGEDDRLKDNPWIRNKIRSSPSQEIALQLNIDDVTGIKDFMQDLSSKHIIPHMEHKIRILNQQVSATRKGFRNQIKNLWWRKGKDDMPEAQNGSTYTFSSIESHIRVLGDYAFMLRDYELALSNYRLLSTDYKLDKAWMRYAGIQVENWSYKLSNLLLIDDPIVMGEGLDDESMQEMMGLCFFMLDQSRKESEYCMEAAFTTYLKMGLAGQRNAMRCGLWWADILKARGQHKDAASIYFRISNEEPILLAAVMLEQASYCYLLSKPPMLRKYGFHLVLAGNRYNRSNQKQHAIRMYRNALAVYKGHDWNYISDHVHFSIGRWYALLGISDVAIKHMLEVLACSRQSLTTQDLFLREFFHAVEKMGTTFEVNKLQLPVINMSSYKVIYEDHRTYSSSADVSVSESLWQSLEEEMVPSTSNVRSNWLDSQSKVSPSKKYNDSRVCVVGEAIKLDIEFQNPLQISISVSGISLICQLSANSEETKSDRTGLQDDEKPGELPSCRNLNNDSSSLITPEFDLVLGGRETKRVQLEVTPKVEGILKVIGVRWKLSGLVGGCRYFEFETKKKSKRGKRGPKQSLTSDLNFIVIKGLPKLEGCIRDVPGKAYAGELRLFKLELRNQSEYSVKNMKLRISDPRFLIPGSLEDLNKQFSRSSDAMVKSENMGISANVMEKPNSLLFSFPNDSIIHGGTTFVWPLWFHTGRSGNITIYLSIYYEMEGCSSEMIYRTLRMHYDVEVLPSLEVSLLISPCPSRLEDFLVRMDILNRNSECFSLQQLSCVGNQWEIASLPTYVSICPSQNLLAGQALSCFFKIKHCMEGSVDESKLTIKGRDVSLGTKEKEELIDISLSPLADFHHQERYHQRTLVEVSRNTIDFILISKKKEDDANLEPGAPSTLLSYHMCNCSINSKCPIWWSMDGPRTILHDFSSDFCEATLHVTIQNCSKAVASIRITTFDGLPDTYHSSNAVKGLESDGYQEGWHDVPLVNDIKVISDAQGARPKKSSSQSVSPFIWCASSTTQVTVGPECTTEVPLRICLFSPGTYDLSNYELRWKLQPSEGELLTDDLKESTSGMIRGHPFYLTAVQSVPTTLE